jgi:hypothetical protein
VAFFNPSISGALKRFGATMLRAFLAQRALNATKPFQRPDHVAVGGGAPSAAEKRSAEGPSVIRIRTSTLAHIATTEHIDGARSPPSKPGTETQRGADWADDEGASKAPAASPGAADVRGADQDVAKADGLQHSKQSSSSCTRSNAHVVDATRATPASGRCSQKARGRGQRRGGGRESKPWPRTRRSAPPTMGRRRAACPFDSSGPSPTEPWSSPFHAQKIAEYFRYNKSRPLWGLWLLDIPPALLKKYNKRASLFAFCGVCDSASPGSIEETGQGQQQEQTTDDGEDAEAALEKAKIDALCKAKTQSEMYKFIMDKMREEAPLSLTLFVGENEPSVGSTRECTVAEFLASNPAYSELWGHALEEAAAVAHQVHIVRPPPAVAGVAALGFFDSLFAWF